MPDSSPTAENRAILRALRAILAHGHQCHEKRVSVFPPFYVRFGSLLRRFRHRHEHRSQQVGRTLRIDRWLYYCRFFKTRSKASAAVAGGHVRLNGRRAAPGARVAVGDRIDLVRDRLAYSLEVVAIPPRRGPAPEAQSCYAEDEASVRERQATIEMLRQDRLLMPRTEGRPDKRTRRKLRERRER